MSLVAQRKPKSVWSKINRERVKRLIDERQMTPAGQVMIDLAKKTGTWLALDNTDNMVIPEDLQRAFKRNKGAQINFNAFPPSSKRIILGWIQSAKRAETRQQRIMESVELAAKNVRANHYKRK